MNDLSSIESKNRTIVKGLGIWHFIVLFFMIGFFFISILYISQRYDLSTNSIDSSLAILAITVTILISLGILSSVSKEKNISTLIESLKEEKIKFQNENKRLLSTLEENIKEKSKAIADQEIANQKLKDEYQKALDNIRAESTDIIEQTRKNNEELIKSTKKKNAVLMDETQKEKEEYLKEFEAYKGFLDDRIKTIDFEMRNAFYDFHRTYTENWLVLIERKSRLFRNKEKLNRMRNKIYEVSIIVQLFPEFGFENLDLEYLRSVKSACQTLEKIGTSKCIKHLEYLNQRLKNVIDDSKEIDNLQEIVHCLERVNSAKSKIEERISIQKEETWIS